jgi:hypothetical protein
MSDTENTIESEAVTFANQGLGSDEQKLAAIVKVFQQAAIGDCEARIVGVASGKWGELATAINLLLDTNDAFVREAAAAMHHCSNDEFYRPIMLRGLQGSFRQSARTINGAGLKMKQSSEQIKAVADHFAGATAQNV